MTASEAVLRFPYTTVSEVTAEVTAGAAVHQHLLWFRFRLAATLLRFGRPVVDTHM